MRKRNSVFVVRFLQDGNTMEVFTNIRAFHNFIIRNAEKTNHTPERVVLHKEITKTSKYSYSSLLKEVREAQEKNHSKVAAIKCKENHNIEVTECFIRNK